MNLQQKPSKSPLAIVGIACQLPDADSPEQYWENLIRGVDSVHPASEVDWKFDPQSIITEAKGVKDRATSTFGGWQPDTNDGTDRYFSWTKQCSEMALRDANIGPSAALRQRCANVIGSYSWTPTLSSIDPFLSLYKDKLSSLLKNNDALPQDKDLLAVLAETLEDLPTEAFKAGKDYIPGTLASVIAKELGLTGPSYSIDAACASSVYALKLAGLHLYARQSDVAVVTAISAGDPLFTIQGFAALQALPQRGSSRPFDRSSDGIAPAEGCVSFVIKRLEDAQLAGDKIYGVVRGIGVSNDGRGKHLLAPQSSGQQTACTRALAEAQVGLDSIDYIDCHGTGTSLGDKTELQTLANLYPMNECPWIGTAKSNIGHLLTAAGLVSMLKVILSMQAETYAPTIGIENPLRLEDRPDISDKIVQTATPWPQRGETRRSAVNSFGFGGANSQVIVDQFPTEAAAHIPPFELLPMHVTGIACKFGACSDLDAVKKRMFSGESDIPPVDEARWNGLNPVSTPAHTIVDVDLDALRYQLLPESIEKMNPLQLLILDVADKALLDSGIEKGGRVAVIIAYVEDLTVHRLQMRWRVEALLNNALTKTGLTVSPQQYQTILDLLKDAMHPSVGTADFNSYIGNLMASRVSSLWNFSGPAFSLSAGKNSTAQGLEVSRLLLSNDEVDAVVLGAVDLAAHTENILIRHLEASADSTKPATPCDGAGALVLSRQVSAEQTIHATIESETIGADEIETHTDFRAHEISLLQTNDPKRVFEEISKQTDTFAKLTSSSVCLANSTSLFGDSYAASQMLDLILAISAIADRCLPPARNRQDWHPLPDPFYTPDSLLPWTRTDAHPRTAVIHTSDATNQTLSTSCIFVSDRFRRPSPARMQAPLYDGRQIVAINAKDMSHLLKQLSQLSAELTSSCDFEGISYQWLTQFDQSYSGPCAVLCGTSPEIMRQDIQRLSDHIQVTPNTEWHSPEGSRMAPDPLGLKGKVSFLYPPFNTPYPNIQPDLASIFPTCMDRFEALFPDTESALGSRQLFPRAKQPLNPSSREAFENELRHSTFSVFRAGLAHSFLSSIALRDVLGIKPDFAMGYSMGDMSMLFGLGVWEFSEEWIQQIASSGILESEIGGDHRLVRHYFGLKDSDPLHWASCVVLVNADYAKKTLQDMDRVFVSQASTHEETIISGLEPDLSIACKRLGKDFLQVENALSAHTPVAKELVPRLVSLLQQKTQRVPDIDFRFSGRDSPQSWTDSEVAQSVVKGIAGYLDFPQLIEDAYGDGARIFIEVGAQNTCTRKVQSILSDKPHLAIATDSRGASVRDKYASLIAALLAHRVPVQLNAWIDTLRPPAKFGLKFTKSIARTQLKPQAVSQALTPLKHSKKPTVSQVPSISQLSTTEPPAISKNDHMAWLKQQRALLLAPAEPQNPSQPPNGNNAVNTSQITSECMFDEADVMEFAEGKLARVFGPEYAEFDTYPQRLRVPSPPFMALSRVISIQAKPFVLEPCSIVTEYDVPARYWGSVGQHTTFMTADAQGVLFLLGYIGIDRWLEGKRTYRWLDAKMKFSGISLPAGSTVRYHIRVRSFTQLGQMLLFVTDFDCDVNGQRFLEIRDCTGGFFTEEDLAKGQGLPAREIFPPNNTFRFHQPLCRKTTLNELELSHWQRGRIASCFGHTHTSIETNSPLLRLMPGPMRFIDQVPAIKSPNEQGPHLISEKWLETNDWYLRTHFKDAPVFAGPCMVEGCYQSLQCYAIYLGLPQLLRGASFSPAEQNQMALKFRGQVPAEKGSFFMHMYVTDIQYGDTPALFADFDLVHKGRVIGRIENLGIRLTREQI
ncbi:MAG: beta-ketoacyl synthase N-terminal-like domain-containing protein [Akkermansiaceae bacterium]